MFITNILINISLIILLKNKFIIIKNNKKLITIYYKHLKKYTHLIFKFLYYLNIHI
jgi:hypothetical protein